MKTPKLKPDLVLYDIDDDPPNDFTGLAYWDVVMESVYIFYLNGEIHREDGPAIIEGNMRKEWKRHGRPFNLNGPVVEWADGTKYYQINDRGYNEHEYWNHPLVVQNKFDKIDSFIL